MNNRNDILARLQHEVVKAEEAVDAYLDLHPEAADASFASNAEYERLLYAAEQAHGSYAETKYGTQ